jgi:hypothetical protein
MSARLALPPGKWVYNKKTGDGKLEYWIGILHWNPAGDGRLVFKLSPAHPLDECSWSADPGSSTPPSRAALVASMRKESLRAYALKATVMALSRMDQARVVPEQSKDVFTCFQTLIKSAGVEQETTHKVSRETLHLIPS